MVKIEYAVWSRPLSIFFDMVFFDMRKLLPNSFSLGALPWREKKPKKKSVITVTFRRPAVVENT